MVCLEKGVSDISKWMFWYISADICYDMSLKSFSDNEGLMD